MAAGSYSRSTGARPRPPSQAASASLVAAGIFDYKGAVLRVLPADKEVVAAHVAKGLADRALYFSDEGGNQAVEALAVALSASGIEQATRLAEAVVGAGSKEYVTSWGPILDMFSKLAENGQLTAISRAWRLFSTFHPDNAHLVRESVPAKISSLYLAGNRGINAGQIAKWTSAQPDWADHLKASLQDPALFKRTIDAMAEAIEAGGP